MKIDKFEILSVGMEPLDEHEFGDELEKLVEVRQSLEVADFNEKALNLMERLLWTRQEIKIRTRSPEVLAKRRAQATQSRTWCDAECIRHQFHAPDGTPTNYVGDPVPVSEPYRYDPTKGASDE